MQEVVQDREQADVTWKTRQKSTKYNQRLALCPVERIYIP